MQGNFKYPGIKKIHQILEKITRFDQKGQNPLCLVITLTVVYKNILHINLHILYIIHIKTSSRIIKIHQVHQKLQAKQFLLFC